MAMRRMSVILLLALALAATGCLDKGYLETLTTSSNTDPLLVVPVAAHAAPSRAEGDPEFNHLRHDAWIPTGSLLLHGGMLHYAANTTCYTLDPDTKIVTSRSVTGASNSWFASFAVVNNAVYVLHNELRRGGTDGFTNVARAFRSTTPGNTLYSSTNAFSKTDLTYAPVAITPDGDNTGRLVIIHQAFGQITGLMTMYQGRMLTNLVSSSPTTGFTDIDNTDEKPPRLVDTPLGPLAWWTTGNNTHLLLTYPYTGTSLGVEHLEHHGRSEVYPNLGQWDGPKEGITYASDHRIMGACTNFNNGYDVLRIDGPRTQLLFTSGALTTTTCSTLQAPGHGVIEQASLLVTADGVAWVAFLAQDAGVRMILYACARRPDGTWTTPQELTPLGGGFVVVGSSWHAINPVFCHTATGARPDTAYLKYVSFETGQRQVKIVKLSLR